MKYNEFINNQLILESVLYLIRDFKSVLVTMSKDYDSEIAADILDMELTDVEPDVTFISIGDREGYVKFSTERSVVNNIEKFFKDWLENEKRDSSKIRINDLKNRTLSNLDIGDVTDQDLNKMYDEYGLKDKSRNDLKIGKLINKLFPGKYNSQQIEMFTNVFKSLATDSDVIKEVIGEDIKKWYLEDNYFEKVGSLGSSCMRNQRSQNFFNIYIENPEVCKMVVVLEGGKLVGRAIVWKIDSNDNNLNFEWVMDRQYSTRDSVVEKMKRYAEEQGWAYRTNNNHYSISKFTYEGKEYSMNIEIRIKSKDYGKYPYMDTFGLYDKSSGILTNIDEDNVNEDPDYEGWYCLKSTAGGYSEVNSDIYSVYEDDFIDRDDAVWSDIVDSYLSHDNCAYIEGYYGGVYPTDHEDIRYSDYSNEYYHYSECFYSEYNDDYIHEDDAIWAIDFIYSSGYVGDSGVYLFDQVVSTYEFDDMEWFKQLSENVWGRYGLEDDYIDKSTLTKNYEDDWIPETMSISTFKVMGPIKDMQQIELGDVDHLTLSDALILGWEVEKDGRVEDIISYNSSIRKLVPKMKKIAVGRLKAFKDKSMLKGQQVLFDKTIDIKDASNKYSIIEKRFIEIRDNVHFYDPLN